MLNTVIPGLDPGNQGSAGVGGTTWIPGTRPGMTVFWGRSAYVSACGLKPTRRLRTGRVVESMATERRIKTIDRPDGKARLFIIERDDGRYRFEGEAKQDDGDGHGVYWCPCDISGLYSTAEEAEKSAEFEVLWLRDQLSSEGAVRK
jgi:hypothetical protein